jgi:HD domain-containing protein
MIRLGGDSHIGQMVRVDDPHRLRSTLGPLPMQSLQNAMFSRSVSARERRCLGSGLLSVAVPQLLVSRADAIRFLLDAYADVTVRPGKGLPHAQTVADVLRAAGSDEVTQLAGLLHDVVEDTARTNDEVRAAFGERVAELVAALTEDDAIERYGQRKRALRLQIAASERAVLDVALADKIATLRHAVLTGTKIAKRKVAHYEAVLELGRTEGGSAPMCDQLEQLLATIARR